MPAPGLDQGGGIVRLKLRMALEADGAIPGQARIGGEVGGGDHSGIWRWGHDLILMRDGDGDTERTRVHPVLRGGHLIAVQADAPALVRLLDTTTEGMGHDLVTEADADQPGPASGGTKPVDQQRYPGQIVIDPRRRARDYHAGEGRRILRQFARLDIEPGGGHALAQQGPEPRRIVVEVVLQRLGRVAGLKNGDTGHDGSGWPTDMGDHARRAKPDRLCRRHGRA